MLLRSIVIKTARTERHFSNSSGKGTWKTNLYTRFESAKNEFLQNPLKNLMSLLGTLVILGEVYSHAKMFRSDYLAAAIENSKSPTRDWNRYVVRTDLESRLAKIVKSNIGHER
jgi:hypothetical protein